MTKKEIIKMTELKSKAIKIHMASRIFLDSLPDPDKIITEHTPFARYEIFFRVYNNFILFTLKN